MLTPLSISPYNSRFTLDIDLADKIYINTYEYVNMIYHGFYGGTSLQSQELNELQENIQNQLSLANILSGNWLQYPKTTVPDVENYIVHSDIFPVDPQGITFVAINSSTLNLSKGYYLYPTEWGNISFVGIPQMNNITTSSGDLYTGISFSNIQSRTVSGVQTNWNILRDNDNDTFNNVGANRIQLFLNEYTNIPPTQRSQIYAVSWYPISGNVLDWSAGGTNDVVQFDYVKPSVSLMMNGTALFDYGTSPFPGSDFEQACVDNLLPGAIQRQLRMLEDNNNLLNTNIKNIIPHRYDSGTLFKNSPGSEFLIWPTPEKMSQFKNDWIEVLRRIDDNKSNADGLLIANTRLLADQETIGQNNNFTITPASYTTITNSPKYTLPLYDTLSLFSQMNGITWDGQGTAFCGPAGCGYNTDYLVWNKSAEKLMTAAFSEVFLTPFKQRYSNIVSKVRSTNYESNITRPNDGYPDINGHESYHDNLFGDSASIALYGLFNSSSDVWGISGDSNLARIPTGQPTFTWHGNPWNAFMISIQGVRSSRRGFIYNNKINNSIFVWIAPKDFKGLPNTSTLVGFNNSPYWDEMVRHSALTGVEVFGFFNGLEATTTSDTDKAKRIEQFTVINNILSDINTKLGGYTPISLDVRRISYNSEYVISGAPTIDGKFLWRVTPKRENNIILVNGSVVIKKVGEIGVWITTNTQNAPNISIQDADMHQYFSRVAFDGGRQNQHDWGAWGNKTIAMYNGTRLEANNSSTIQSRPFGAFFTNPNGLTSSSWHNIIYELTYPIFKWGNRSILYQFPFGGFRIDNQFNGEAQYGEEGPVAGYMRFKDLYPNGGTNPSQCSARWKGMKEAFNDVINGKLTPTDTSYLPIDKPCNIVIYLPGFMGWATYREETCKYWEDLSTTGTDEERNTAFYQKLDSYINDIIYIQKNGTSSTGVKGRLYIGIDSTAYSATPESISAYGSISKTESASDVSGAAYTKFGYKAKGVGWYATNGGYRTDKLELADWYVKTKLEQAGISVLAEARPASTITQISIPEVSGGVYRGNTTTPLPVTSWGNFASVESTMWTSRTYTAANEKFDEILRWPSNSFEVVHNTQNPEGNVFNLPSKISVLVNGVTYEKRHYPDWNAIPLVYSPFYYLHTLNALVDHIKYNDKRNANVVDRTDIQLNHKNIITLETSFYANTLDIPFANNSESSTGEYYIWNKDTMGVSSYYAEPRELFEIDDFVALPPQDYTGGLWTSGVTGNKAYWDNTFRGASFGEFISKIRTISSQVSPPVGVSNGVITEYANNFTFSTTYPNDTYSTNMLKDIIGVTVSDPYLLTPTSGLSADCSEIISRLSSTIKSLTGFTGSLGVTLNWQSHIADSSVTQGIKNSTGNYLISYYGYGQSVDQNSLSYSLKNLYSKSRYKRGNIVSEFPTLASTALEVHTPSYAFEYDYHNVPPELTGVTADAFRIGQTDTFYGSFLRQYGPAICLVYKKLKNLIDLTPATPPTAQGFTFNNTHILTLKEKCLDILNEVTKYNNGLQRANWNFAPLSPHIIGPIAITDDYYITLDGNIQKPGGAGGYLSSPWAISGIVNMVSILGDDVSPLLLRKLKILVTHEVLLIVKNWKQYLSWYVNGNQSNTNQWQEPAMGLIEACIFIKDSNLLPAYNLGVALVGESLLTSLGSDGGFPEGFGYALSVTPQMDDVLLKMMSMGDTRLNTISSEWAKNHWKWNIDHLFIGNRIINYSDNSTALLPSYAYNSPYNAINKAVYTAAKYNIGSSPDSNGVYDYQPLKNLNVIYPTTTTVMTDVNQLDWFKLSGLSGSSAGTGLIPLPLFNHYKNSELYVWRSGRASIFETSNGSAGTTHFGIWTKGSTKKDGHVHRDAGQLSVYCGNRLVLLDCGQNYSHPNSFSVFAGQTAHNMMQIDAIPNEWPVYSGWTGCPITVNNHSATGGNISINTIGAYRGPSVIIPECPDCQTIHQQGRVKSISRGITWGLDTGTLKVTILDGVTFGTTSSSAIDISGNTEHYRWHTGSTAAINAGFTFIKMSTGLGWTANWDNGKSILSILPSREIIVSGATYPNYSLTGVLEAHNVLIIKPTAAGSTFSMTTSLIITT